jgi:nucleoside-diphosphate-sugar epimerase
MQNPLVEDLDFILAETRDLWQELRGARLFITGGTGFVGCWLLETLVRANRQLGLHASATVLTRNPAAFEMKAPHLAGDPAVELHPGDVRTFEGPAGTFSHIVHAATDMGAVLHASQPAATLDTIVQGTRRTLDFALNCGATRFLLVSSGAVYGRQLPLVRSVPETYAGGPSPADPASAYGEGKRIAELLCAIYAKSFGLEATIARCFGVIGPYMPLATPQTPGGYIRDALWGGPVRVAGDGGAYRSYLYASDLMIWLWTTLLRGRAGRAYNVGSEEEVTSGQMAALVAAEAGQGTKVATEGAQRRGEPAERYVPSTARARHELELKVRVDLAAAVQKTVDWARQAEVDAPAGLLEVAR